MYCTYDYYVLYSRPKLKCKRTQCSHNELWTLNFSLSLIEYSSLNNSTTVCWFLTKKKPLYFRPNNSTMAKALKITYIILLFIYLTSRDVSLHHSFFVCVITQSIVHSIFRSILQANEFINCIKWFALIDASHTHIHKNAKNWK